MRRTRDRGGGRGDHGGSRLNTDDKPPGLAIAHSVADDGATVVRLTGYLDMSTVQALTTALTPLLRESHNVRIDLMDLTFVDSAGLREFLGAYRRAETSGIGYRIINPRGHVKQVMEVSGTYEYLTDGLDPPA